MFFYLKNYIKTGMLFLILLFSLNSVFAATIEETFKKRLDCIQNSLIIVENSNGRIEVSSWDNQEIEIVAYKRVEGSEKSAAKLMERIEIEIEQDECKIKIETVVPKSMDGDGGFFSWLFGDKNPSYSVQYEIKVPYESDLDLNTTNGKIITDKVSGKIRLKTTNGKIDAENIKGVVRCQTTNGSINVEFDEITSEDEMTFRTTNGSIKLYFPENYGGYADLKTTNGHIDSDFRLESSRNDSRRSRKSYNGKFGEGEGSITCKTTNGSIYLLMNE